MTKFVLSEFFENLKGDFLKKEYYPLKITNFFINGSLFALFPFITLQAKTLGITIEELGLIYSFLPVVGISAPIIAGIIGDKLGNFKVFLSVILGLSGLASLLFYAVPPARVESNLPEKISANVSCVRDREAAVEFSIKEGLCHPQNGTLQATLEVEKCRLVCDGLPEGELKTIQAADLGCSLTDGCFDIHLLDDYTAIGNFTINLTISGNLSNQIYHEEFENSLTDGKSNFCFNFDQKKEELKKLSNIQYMETLNSCKLECMSAISSSSICANEKFVEVKNPIMSSAIFGLARIINGFTVASSLALFDGAIVAVITKDNGDMGLQRLFCNLGMLILTPLSGYLIDIYSTESETNFLPAYVIYIVSKSICALMVLFMDLDFKKPSRRVLMDFKELIRLPEVLVFIFFTGINGMCFGFLETFLFWFLEDLKAEKWLMGMTVTVGSLVGMPILFFASPIVEKFGHVNTLSFCLAAFGARMVGYSLIENPWFAMPYEALECITIALSSVAAMSYTGELSTPLTVASLQGIYNGVTHGIGRGLGSIVGGTLIRFFGIRVTMQILGGICGLSSLLYCLLNYTLVPKWRIERKRINELKTKEQMAQNKPDPC